MVHIPDVVLELILPTQGVAPVDLSPSRDAWSHFMTTSLTCIVEGEVLHQQRTRSNHRHVALEHIPELRQFVDGCGAHKTPYFRQSPLIGKEVACRIALIGHGFELHNLENLAVQSRTRLEEKHTTAFVGESQQEHGCQEDGRGKQEQEQTDQNVGRAFDVGFVEH